MSPRPASGAYIVRADLAQPHLLGVMKKVEAQIDALSKLPAEVRLFYPSGGSVIADGQVARKYGRGTLWRRLNHYGLFYLHCVRWLPKLDFLYLRYQGTSPLLLWMLWRLKKQNPGVLVLLEVPTYPYDKAVGGKLWLRLVDSVCRTFLRYFVHRIITFSNETEIFGIKTIRTRNGVDVANTAIVERKTSTRPFRILGLANLSYWHGYDRVIDGISNYLRAGGETSVIFEVVGSGKELPRLIDTAKRLGVENNVRFHGPLHGQQLDEVMRQCHIGIGCMGMHRIDVDTSDLKSREYCARGIPFVTSFTDEDFPYSLRFVFHAPPDDSPLEIASVIQFYDSLDRTNENIAEEMRLYAEQMLTWHCKFRPVMDEIRSFRSQRAS